MTEKRFESTDRIEADRYQVELVQLGLETNGSSLRALQEALNKGARHRWRLISVAQDPTSHGIFIVWDISSPISG